MKKRSAIWLSLLVATGLLLAPTAMAEDGTTDGLTPQQAAESQLEQNQPAAHYWQGLGLADTASSVTLGKGEYLVCVKYKSQFGYGKLTLNRGGDRMTLPMVELANLVGANVSWQADSGLSTFQVGDTMAVFNTKLPLLYLGTKGADGVVSYEKSDLPQTLETKDNRLHVYLDVLYRLGITPIWDDHSDMLTLGLSPDLYGVDAAPFAPSELVATVAADLEAEIAYRAELAWNEAFGKTRLKRNAGDVTVGPGEYLIKASAGNNQAYGKIAVSGSKVPLKDLAPLLGADVTYDGQTGLTVYLAGDKVFALSPQIYCIYVGSKGADGKVAYTKTYLSDAPTSIDSRIYVDGEALKALGVTAKFDTTGKVFNLTLDGKLYGISRNSFPVTELTNVIAQDVVKEKEKDHLLATYTTSFNTGNVNRSTNLRLAAAAINGKVVSPGKSFSFNGTVGPRTSQKGYKVAIIYSAGKEIDGIGGGICQVSSTLYNTVLKAGLKVTERHTHSLPVAYVPKGKDATVAYGALDFRFQNNRSYPVTVKATINGGKLTVEIWGK